MIGALIYLTSSRPDIVHATWLCARYQAKPIEKHLKEVKRIFCYLLGTVNTGLWYTNDSGFELTGFLDADYAGCKDTFKSTSGGAQFLGEKLVSWSSKKQDYTVLSTAKAEYVSLSACCAQVLWMRITDYGFHFNNILIYCDSKSAIAITCNPVQHSRTKHIAVRYHFIKEHVEKGTIELYFVKTDYQLTDIFTKALPADRFNYLVCCLGMRSLSPKELERLAKSQVILFSIHSDEWKSFQSQHQTALRALVPKQLLGMNLAALWHQQSFVLLQTRSSTSQGDMSHHKDIYDNPSLTKKVFANMKKVGASFSRVVTELFDTMLVPAAEEVVDTDAPNVAKEKSFKQGRIIAEIDEDVKINLEEAQAKLYKIDLEHPEKVLSMQDVNKEEPTEVKEVLEVAKDAKLMTYIVTTAGATTTAEAPKVIELSFPSHKYTKIKKKIGYEELERGSKNKTKMVTFTREDKMRSNTLHLVW
nr:copia protein [Tanacetum cinerariifolium]